MPDLSYSYRTVGLWKFNDYRRMIMDADRAFAAFDDPPYPSSPVTLLVRVCRTCTATRKLLLLTVKLRATCRVA